ncbi:MAG: hypothetical protein PHS17_13485, partial [Desulfobacterales bacterium]|nr:hypothetical protein [Desulfobacterales bacterium]
MLGLFYLIFSFFVGYRILKTCLPGSLDVSGTKSLFGKDIRLPNWMIVVPASFFLGTLVLTWTTYLLAYACKSSGNPMGHANFIVLVGVSAILIWCVYKAGGLRIKHPDPSSLKTFFLKNRLEIIFILVALSIASYLMFRSFSVRDGTMYLGLSVFSDFGTHLATIRSFSIGLNFPTQYPHFPDGHIRYHFLFQFLVANLEFLGLRIDWAFNLPSILSMVFFLMTLYSFSVVILGERWVGILTAVFFYFRSSFAFFTYAVGTGSIYELIHNMLSIETHIGRTPHEEWGLWAQKTFINQRHFPFALGLFLFFFIILYPLCLKMTEALKNINLSDKFREFMLKPDAWVPNNILRAVAIGSILGLMSFWNGAVVLATLLVLLVMALFSKHRLEFVIIAAISVFLSSLESAFFIGPGNSALKCLPVVGFIAERKDLLGILGYYTELLGPQPWLVLAGLLLAPRGSRRLALAFMAPIIIANSVQLTPDITMNHKFVIISVLLLNNF